MLTLVATLPTYLYIRTYDQCRFKYAQYTQGAALMFSA